MLHLEILVLFQGTKPLNFAAPDPQQRMGSCGARAGFPAADVNLREPCWGAVLEELVALG